MNAVVFDTLILSRKLAASGMPIEQAQGVAAAIAETLGEQIVTQRDVRELDQRIHTRFRELEQRIDTRFRDLEQRVDTRFREQEQRVDTRCRELETRQEFRFKELEAAIRASKQRQTIRLGAMLAGGIVLVGALVKLL